MDRWSLVADEIVGADGAAEIRPATCLPIVDDASVAHELLESLGLAYRRVELVPHHPQRAPIGHSRGEGAFGMFQHTLRCANNGVYEIQPFLQYRQLFRF